MKRVTIICEGQTEKEFSKDVLYLYFKTPIAGSAEQVQEPSRYEEII